VEAAAAVTEVAALVGRDVAYVHVDVADPALSLANVTPAQLEEMQELLDAEVDATQHVLRYVLANAGALLQPPPPRDQDGNGRASDFARRYARVGEGGPAEVDITVMAASLELSAAPWAARPRPQGAAGPVRACEVPLGPHMLIECPPHHVELVCAALTYLTSGVPRVGMQHMQSLQAHSVLQPVDEAALRRIYGGTSYGGGPGLDLAAVVQLVDAAIAQFVQQDPQLQQREAARVNAPQHRRPAAFPIHGDWKVPSVVLPPFRVEVNLGIPDGIMRRLLRDGAMALRDTGKPVLVSLACADAQGRWSRRLPALLCASSLLPSLPTRPLLTQP